MVVVGKRTFMRMVSIILTLTIMISTLGLGGIVHANTSQFTDIEGSYAKEQIEFLANENIFTGYQDGTFRPKQEVTRAELAKVLVYTLGLEEDPSAAEVFTDVPDHAWYKGVVGALVKSGLTSGTSSTTFSPNKKVSREELAVFFVRAFQLEEKAKELHLAADISDFADVSSWAKDSVALAFEIGYINGMKNEDGSYRFHPKGNTERQAIAKLAYGFYANKEEFLNNAQKVYDLHFGKKIVGIDDNNSKVIFDDGLELGMTNDVKLILNKENEDVLKDAIILYEQNENDEIIAITRLILDTSGMAAEAGQAEFSGNIVLDGNSGTINGDVIVKGDYTTIKKLTITGDLYIDESVENDFKAVDVSVEGTSYVNGGDENTVVFVGSTLVNVEVNNPNVRVQALTTNIQNAIMSANGSTLEGDSASNIISITIHADVTVTGELIIQEVIIESSNVNVTLNTTEEIPNVTVTAEGVVLLGSSPIASLIVPTEGDVDNQLENEPDTTQDSNGNVISESNPPNSGGYTPPRDTTPPNVIITTTASNLTNKNPIPITITFSEAVIGFEVGDIEVENGIVTHFIGSGTTYTADIIRPSGDGEVIVDIAAGVATDTAGNGNSAATQLSIEYDGIAPTVTIATTSSNSTNKTPIPITITFSEAVTGFEVGDIAVRNGTVGNFEGSGTNYTAIVTPLSEGEVTVDIPYGVALDPAGNSNIAASRLSIDYDITSPTVTFRTDRVTPTNTSSIIITIEFSEPVTEFEVGDIVVGNGSINDFTEKVGRFIESGTTYTANISPLSEGEVRIDIADGVALDMAGNLNLANNLSFIYDSVEPTISITSTAGERTNQNPIPITFTFSEEVIGFDYVFVYVTNGALNDFEGSGTTYTANITPLLHEGKVIVNIPASVAFDVARNPNTATEFSIVYDHISPTVTGVTNGNSYNVDVTPEFTEGTATLAKDGGTSQSYSSGTAITEEGNYVLVVRDEAGNTTSVIFSIDKTVPVVTAVTDAGLYNDNKTITFNEGTATLAKDGGTAQPFSSGTTITEEGVFVLVVTDETGNVTTVNFTIDKTAPVVTGVENGITYNDNVTAEFSEGIATLTWVDVYSRAFTSGELIENEGSYVLVVRDDAGNETTINFTIDKIAPAATISPTTAEYDLYSPSNVTTTITWNNSQSITGINDGSGDLSYTLIVGPPDYSAPTSADGATGTLTINQSYFDRIGVTAGETITLSIIFNGLDSGVTEETFTINIIDSTPVEITAFDGISDVDGGFAGAATYENALDVISYLDKNIIEATITGTTDTVPLELSWVDTDGYDSTTPGRYTFTAAIGTLPTGYVDTVDTISEVTVEVVVADPVDITAATVTITPAVVGGTPEDATTIEVATSNPDFTVTSVTWDPTYHLTDIGTFKPYALYKANIILTSKNDSEFQSASFTPTVAGAYSVGGATSTGTGVGNTVSFTVEYRTTYRMIRVLDVPDGIPEGSGTTIADPTIWDISVANDKTALGLADIEIAEEATKNLYTDAGFTNEITGVDSIPLEVLVPKTVYIKVTSQDGIAQYYAVTITRESYFYFAIVYDTHPSTVTMWTNSTLNYTSSSPSANDFIIGGPNADGRTVTAVKPFSIGVELTLSKPLLYGDNITVSYEPLEGNLIDTSGESVAAFSNMEVDNRVIVSRTVTIEEITPSNNTVIGIDNIGITVDANTGVTVGDLKSAIQATDGSPQTYSVLDASNNILSDIVGLNTGYKLEVTAADGTTTVVYTINVLSDMTTLGIATSNPADIIEINNTLGSETIAMKNLSHTVSELINGVTAENINISQAYEVTTSDGSTTKATIDMVTNGDKLIVTAENGVDTVAYNISIDTVAPTVTAIEYVDNNHLRLTFDEPLDLTTSEDESNYTLSGALTGSVIVADRGGIDNKKVTLEVPSMLSMADGQSITVTVSNVEDRYGNIVDSAANSQTYTKPTAQPSIVDVAVVDDLTLMVFFSESVSESAVDVGNYAVDGPYVVDVEFIGSEQNIVRLTVDSPFFSALTAFNVTDSGGTIMSATEITLPFDYSTAPTFSPSDGATSVLVNQSLTITFSGQARMLDGTPLDSTNVDSLISLYDDTLKIPVVFDATVSADGSGNTVIIVTGEQNFGPETGQTQQLLNGHTYTLSVGPAKASGILTLPATTTFTTMP